MTEIDEDRALYAKVHQMVLLQVRGFPVQLSTSRFLGTLLKVVEEHAPAEHEGRLINSLGCPRHNPSVMKRPDLVPDEELDTCPDCEIGRFVCCSSSRCFSCDYPCDTLMMIAQELGVLPPQE